jgi:CRP-like cAMP-binding protein
MESLFAYFDTIHPLPLEAKTSIAHICTRQTVKRNQVLQSVGHTCRTIYFIKRGLARIYYFKDDTDVTEFFAFEQQILARAESLFTGRPSLKGIQMLEDSEVIAIQAPALFALYDTFPAVERLFRIIFEQAYVDTVNRVESLQFQSPEERYHALLKDSPDVLKRVPLKMIASYIGITPVSLSRIRARF